MTLARPATAGTESHAAAKPLARLLALGRPLVMGVLNVTPDSFSDGGRFVDPVTAIGHARRLVADGADLLDIGAESTRPYGGAEAVSLDEEMRRLEPVLPAILDARRTGFDRHDEGDGGGRRAEGRCRHRQ